MRVHRVLQRDLPVAAPVDLADEDQGPHGLPDRRDRLDRRSGDRGRSFGARRESLHRDRRRHARILPLSHPASARPTAGSPIRATVTCPRSASSRASEWTVLQKMIARRRSGIPAHARLWRSRNPAPSSRPPSPGSSTRRAGVRFRFRWVLDATEMGDLLPLAKLPYVAGSEPKSDTGEPHAGRGTQPRVRPELHIPVRGGARGTAKITPSPNRRTMMRSASGRISRCA